MELCYFSGRSSYATSYDGRILVPFAVESSLSGVGKSLGEKNELWYQRQFSVPSKWKGHRILLHFGAVDWKADVWVNKVKVGQHTGGFTPFSFDITPALLNGENELIVKVWDRLIKVLSLEENRLVSREVSGILLSVVFGKQFG